MPLPTFAILFAGLYLPNNGPIGICALRIIAIGAQVVFGARICLVEVKRMFSAVATARHRILPKVHLFVDKNFASCSEKRNFVFWLSPMV